MHTRNVKQLDVEYFVLITHLFKVPFFFHFQTSYSLWPTASGTQFITILILKVPSDASVLKFTFFNYDVGMLQYFKKYISN